MPKLDLSLLPDKPKLDLSLMPDNPTPTIKLDLSKMPDSVSPVEQLRKFGLPPAPPATTITPPSIEGFNPNLSDAEYLKLSPRDQFNYNMQKIKYMNEKKSAATSTPPPQRPSTVPIPEPTQFERPLQTTSMGYESPTLPPSQYALEEAQASENLRNITRDIAKAPARMVREGGKIYQDIIDNLMKVNDVKNRTTLAGSMLRQLPGQVVGTLFDFESLNVEPETLLTAGILKAALKIPPIANVLTKRLDVLEKTIVGNVPKDQIATIMGRPMAEGEFEQAIKKLPLWKKQELFKTMVEKGDPIVAVRIERPFVQKIRNILGIKQVMPEIAAATPPETVGVKTPAPARPPLGLPEGQIVKPANIPETVPPEIKPVIPEPITPTIPQIQAETPVPAPISPKPAITPVEAVKPPVTTAPPTTPIKLTEPVITPVETEISPKKGYMTVYHRTNEPIEQIINNGFISKEYTKDVFVSNREQGQAEGYGKNVIKFQVKKSDLTLDDEFPDGEKHYTLPSNLATKYLKATEGIKPPVIAPQMKEPWQISKTEFNKNYVFHNTSNEIADIIKKEGMSGGSFSDKPGDFGKNKWIVINKNDLPKYDIHQYGKLKAIEPQWEKGIDKEGYPIEFKINPEKINVISNSKNPHKDLVQQALSEGKPVPPEVLKDYPDLQKQVKPTIPPELEPLANKYAQVLGQQPQEFHKKFVSAIVNKDVDYLIDVLAQGQGQNTTSKKFFTEVTGNILPKTIAGIKQSIYNYAGYTPENILARESKLNEIKAQKQAELNKQSKINEEKSLLNILENKKYRYQKKIYSGKELIDDFFNKGYVIQKRKAGIKTIYSVSTKDGYVNFSTKPEKWYIDKKIKEYGEPEPVKPVVTPIAEQPPTPLSGNIPQNKEPQKILPTGEQKTIEMPEIVRLARELSGDIPALKRLANYRGYFKEGKIVLNRNIFKSDIQPSKTLAHEIGHLIDWLPDYILKRGNLLGRLFTLRKFLKNTFGETEIKNKEIRKELLRLTMSWNPYDKSNVSLSYQKYRESAVELYAEAISVLINDPERLQNKAPNFNRIFWENIDRKPDVKQALLNLKNTLELSPADIARARREDVLKMFQKGEDAYRKKHLENRQSRPLRNVLSEGFIDINSDLIKMYNNAVKKGLRVNPDDNPVLWLEENNYIAGKQQNAMEQIDNQIRKPLAEMGITDEIIGEYLFYKNIIEGKSLEEVAPGVFKETEKKIARPLGHTPQTAEKQLDLLRDILGIEKYTRLIGTMEKFYNSGQELMKKAFDAGILTEQQYKITQMNPRYATTQVLDYINTYIAPTFIHQIGTLKEVSNPFTATIMKRLSVIRAIEKNISRKTVYNFLASQNAATPSRGILIGKQIEFKTAEGKGLLKFKQDGTWVGFDIDPYIADGLEYKPDQHINAVMKIFSVLNTKWFKPLYTSFNIGFQSFNFIRDFTRAAKANPKKEILLSMFDVAKNYRLANPRIKNMLSGIEDNIITEMRENKMLAFTYQQTIDMGDITEHSEMNFLMNKYRIGLNEKHPNGVIKKIFNWIEKTGNYIEALPKVAGYIELKSAKEPIPIKEIGHMVRNYRGSPDFRTFGRWGTVYNNIFLFSNAIKQGMRSDWEMAIRNPRTRQGYWWKTIEINILPKILMALAAAGVFGKYLKDNYDRQSEYDKTNYITLPLFIDKQSNAAYFRIPQDEVGRLVGAMIWKILNFNSREIGKSIAQVASPLGGQIPSISPEIDILSGGIMYFSGQSPTDYFRNRTVLNYDESKILKYKGPFHPVPAKRYALYLGGQAGLSTLIPGFKYINYDNREPMTDLQQIIKYTPILSRFLRIGKVGLKQDIAEYQGQKISNAAERREYRKR